MTDPTAIASPCIKVCTLDHGVGQCLGCGRTIAEITQWTRLTDAERAAVMVALPARRRALDAALTRSAIEAAKPAHPKDPAG